MITREEAIKRIDEQYKICEEFYYLSASPEKDCPGVMSYMEALAVAISALRPVSREKVEKVWRGEWIHKRSPYDYKIFVCKKCGKQISIQGENMDFCPACGAAQTDEAVDIIMERMEALKDGTDD